MKSALDHADAVLPGPTSKLSVLTEADKQLTDYELFEKYMGSVTDWGDLWEDAASLACVALRAGGSLFVFAVVNCCCWAGPGLHAGAGAVPCWQ